MQNYLKLGSWNALCDICGFKYKADEIRRRWDGLMVCEFDYEIRHPQDLIRSRPEKNTVPFVRHEAEDVFLHDACTIEGLTAIPGYAMPGCSIPSRVSPLS